MKLTSVHPHRREGDDTDSWNRILALDSQGKESANGPPGNIEPLAMARRLHSNRVWFICLLVSLDFDQRSLQECYDKLIRKESLYSLVLPSRSQLLCM